MLCEDHFRDVAVMHFARRKHPNPMEAATSAMDGGLRAASVPVDDPLPDRNLTGPTVS